MKIRFLLLFLLWVSSWVIAQTTKPNVILIFADDLGPGMLGCYGQKIVKTPNIDQLAEEGMKFTNYYGNVFCAPARWSLLTGWHDGRMGGWNHTKAGLLIQKDQKNISEAEYQKEFSKLKKEAYPIEDHHILLGQVAQEAGYITAQFGKLDRGFRTWNERVQRHGWDHHVGYYDHQRAHGFYPPYLWKNGKKLALKDNTDPKCGKTSEKGLEPVGWGGKTYSQNVFIQEILTYIRNNKDKPFFIYHPTQLPHGPVAIPEIHPDFAQDDRLELPEKKYASMVKMLDDHVGLIMQELKSLGLDQNTLVFFTSDNGHELYYGAKSTYKRQLLPNGEKADFLDKKWRTSFCGDVFNGAGGRAGLKRSGFQGGIQCPMIIRWPGKVKAQTETSLLSTHYDFISTLADIVGRDPLQGKDGISYLPTLLNQPQSKTHDHIVIYNNFKTMGSSTIIDQEGWKAIEIDKKHETFQLYNILNDNEERHELSKQHPEKLSHLIKVLKNNIPASF